MMQPDNKLARTRKIGYKPIVKKENEEKTKFYGVLKLLTTVEIINEYGQKKDIKINNAKGYIPVFKTKEEAEKNNGKGKYQIIELTT